MRVRLLIACCILVLASTPRTKNKCPRANEPTSDSNYKSSVLQKYAKLRFFLSLSLSLSLYFFTLCALFFRGKTLRLFPLSLSLSPFPQLRKRRELVGQFFARKESKKWVISASESNKREREREECY